MWLLGLVLFSFTSSITCAACPDKCKCISGISLPSFGFLPEVRGPQIDCREQGLTQAPHDSDKGYAFLNLDKNKIPHLEILDRGGNALALRHIQADFCDIESIDRFEGDFVTHLSLRGNLFKKVPLTSRSVLFLVLSQNQIPDDHEGNLLYYVKLIRLELTDNKLLSIPKVPRTLRQLFLTSNQITFIDDQILREVPDLSLLAVEKNNLYKINLPEAYFMSKIAQLFVSDNPKMFKDKAVDRWCKAENVGGLVCEIPTEA